MFRVHFNGKMYTSFTFYFLRETFQFFSPAQKLLVFEFQLGPAQKAKKKT